MKALKYCKWEVTIKKQDDEFYWACNTKNDDCGLFLQNLALLSKENFETEGLAKQNFKEWAYLNEIKNYEII